MTGRRISKHLERSGVPLAAFFDVDENKIGRTKRGLPILPREELARTWSNYRNPALLSAVGSRRARPLIREFMHCNGFVEGQDWWCVA